MRLEGRSRHEEKRLDLAQLIATHPSRKALDEGVRLGVLRPLPHEGDVLLGHHLARTETAADDDDGRLLRGVLQARDCGTKTFLLVLGDRDLRLILRVVEEWKATAHTDRLDGRLLGASVLAVRQAHKSPLATLRGEHRLEASLVLRDIVGRLQKATKAILRETEVGRARNKRLDVLLEGRLSVLHGRQLRVGSCVH